MAERPAVNTSPLLFLARGGFLDLLRIAGPEIALPRIVAGEIGCKGAQDVTAKAIAETPWLVVVETPIPPEVIQAWDLGKGESAVLAWAYEHPGTEAILDDLAARRCASALGVPVRGTLGLVLSAKRRGQIRAARPVLDSLRDSGMYLSDTVMNRALALVGE